jgi:hypothetical protein
VKARFALIFVALIAIAGTTGSFSQGFLLYDAQGLLSKLDENGKYTGEYNKNVVDALDGKGRLVRRIWDQVPHEATVCVQYKNVFLKGPAILLSNGEPGKINTIDVLQFTFWMPDLRFFESIGHSDTSWSGLGLRPREFGRPVPRPTEIIVSVLAADYAENYDMRVWTFDEQVVGYGKNQNHKKYESINALNMREIEFYSLEDNVRISSSTISELDNDSYIVIAPFTKEQKSIRIYSKDIYIRELIYPVIHLDKVLPTMQWLTQLLRSLKASSCM